VTVEGGDLSLLLKWSLRTEREREERMIEKDKNKWI
jgi:hypothetical protein